MAEQASSSCSSSSIVPVRATLDGKCKRFGIFAESTFSNVKDLLLSNFQCEIKTIKYKNSADLLQDVNNEEDFKEALQTVPKTGGILRLVLGLETAQEEQEIPAYFFDTVFDVNPSFASNKSVAEEIAEAHRRSTEMLMSWDYEVTSPKVQENIELDWMDKNGGQCFGDWTPPLCDFTGCILSPTSVSGLSNNWAPSQQLSSGSGKVRRVWSGTAPLCTVRTQDDCDTTTTTTACRQLQEKRKHSDSSTEVLLGGPKSRSLSVSSCSSSSGSDSDDDNTTITSHKKKRKLSPTVTMEQVLHQFEKQIATKVTKDMKKRSKKIKNDILETVTNEILQKLEDGSSVLTPKNPSAVASQTDETTTEITEITETITTTTTTTPQFHHENVICDNCEQDIFGARYKCGNCVDYDLCEKCEAIEGVHIASHVFLKMRYPTPLVGYRRYVNGRAQPLLEANVYIDSDSERKNGLGQKKVEPVITAVEEEEQSVIGKCEKRRNRLREEEAEQEQQVEEEEESDGDDDSDNDSDSDDEERIVKPEQKMTIKTKEDVQGRGTSDVWRQEWEKMRDDIDSASDSEKKEEEEEEQPVEEPKIATQEELEIKIKSLDDQLSSALSALQLLKNEIPFYAGNKEREDDDEDESEYEDEDEDTEVEESDADDSENEAPVVDKSMDFLADFNDLFDSDDVVVVCQESKPSQPRQQTPRHTFASQLTKNDLGDFFCRRLPMDEFVYVADFFDLIGPTEDLRAPLVDSDDLTIEFADPEMSSSLIESTTETIEPEDDEEQDLTVSQLVVDREDEEEDLMTVSQLRVAVDDEDEDLLTVSQLFVPDAEEEQDYLTVSQIGASGSSDFDDSSLLTVSQLGESSSSGATGEDLLTMSTVSVTENDDEDFLLVNSMLPFSSLLFNLDVGVIFVCAWGE